MLILGVLLITQLNFNFQSVFDPFLNSICIVNSESVKFEPYLFLLNFYHGLIADSLSFQAQKLKY